MINKIINILFFGTVMLYLSSNIENNKIINISEISNYTYKNNTNNKLEIEKIENYAILNNKYKIHYPNIEYFMKEIDTEIKNNNINDIIFFREYKINYPYIIIIIIIINSIFKNSNKDWTDRLVSGVDSILKSDSNIKFKDIAGMHQIKNDIKDYIDFIKNRDKYIKLKAELPKGILLSGPPGCGKTLIAKAVAGETGINLYAISASDLNEIFVGVGAKRIRQLFQLARENSPSIIFIDEIDSIGVKRGSEFSREYDNVLNKILVEMDGFTNNDNIMVFGATNRLKDLDPALLRSGRFDRKIIIDYPNKDERKEIIEYYFNDKQLDKNILLDRNNYYNNLSKLMSGLSGADIKNISNLSAILAIKNNKDKISNDNVIEALDEILIGIKKKERLMSDNEKNIVAHHEIGHALVSYYLKNTEPPIKISIVPRGENILGFSQQEIVDKKLYTKNELLDKICVLLAGRIVEEIYFGGEYNGGVTNGASDDIDKITKILYSIYFEYGMINNKINYTNQKYVSSYILNNLNTSMQKLLRKLENKTKDILNNNIENIDKLVKELLDKEILLSNDLENIIGIENKNSI